MANASAPLPLLPTTVVGSHARPAWWWLANEAIQQGRFGERDVAETLDHAVDVAILDQERLGIDVISDGEMRRRSGFLHSLFERIAGYSYMPQTQRYWGPPHYDQDRVLSVNGRISAPRGLGVAESVAYLRAHTERRIKATCPGPLSLTYRCRLNAPYTDFWELAHDMAPIVNAELKACVAAGADFVQIDDPSLRNVSGEGRRVVDLVNRVVDGVAAKTALHVCFGNQRGRPSAFDRGYRAFFPDLLDARVDQFIFEFANRQMAEIDLWQRYQPRQELVVGVVDQKCYTVETPEFVAERIRMALQYVPADKLWLSPDCGLNPTPYWIALGKLRAMVEGAAIVRRELTGS
jgi:5-methyltetrahydropteroyltriglutamate--homocysteine methyltransferase